MTDFTVQIEGLDKIQGAFKLAPELVRQEVNKALFVSAKEVEKQAKISILSGKKTGRAYKRRSITHQASAPGEAPASDRGRLVGSINSFPGDGESVVIAGNGAVHYARLLEFGTSKMAPRPFFFPALEKSRQFIKTRLAEAISRALAAVK